MPSTTVPPGEVMASDVAQFKKASLDSTITDLDALIESLRSARDTVAQDPSRGDALVSEAQSNISTTVEKMNRTLVRVSKSHKAINKTLDRLIPVRPLPSTGEMTSKDEHAVDTAIMMHLLREGHFDVVEKIQQETSQRDFPDGNVITRPRDIEPSAYSGPLKHMQEILSEIQQHNIDSAMEWALQNLEALERRHSTLILDLVRLRFMWLARGPDINGLPASDDNGVLGAIRYGRQVFPKVPLRYQHQLRMMISSLLFLPNIAGAPYQSLYEVEAGFHKAAVAFKNDFCSLLGLAPESPLYQAITAGSLALPQVLKFEKIKHAKTGWTTVSELPFETPLPPNLLFHPIFVCPVMKEQTTRDNPPRLLPCGHVICKAAIEKLQSRNPRFKCPYCPVNSEDQDVQEINF